MTMQGSKPAAIAPVVSTPVFAAMPKVSRLRPIIAQVLPPLLVLAVLIAAWQFLASGPNATLPPPTKVWADARDLIVDPFYDRGGLDKGLFWHLLASLQRVALGFALAAVAGILLGLLVGTSDFAMRGLDPIFQSVTDEKAQQRLVAAYDHDVTQPEWALGYRWDIVLDGAHATPPDVDGA